MGKFSRVKHTRASWRCFSGVGLGGGGLILSLSLQMKGFGEFPPRRAAAFQIFVISVHTPDVPKNLCSRNSRSCLMFRTCLAGQVGFYLFLLGRNFFCRFFFFFFFSLFSVHEYQPSRVGRENTKRMFLDKEQLEPCFPSRAVKRIFIASFQTKFFCGTYALGETLKR